MTEDERYLRPAMDRLSEAEKEFIEEVKETTGGFPESFGRAYEKCRLAEKDFSVTVGNLLREKNATIQDLKERAEKAEADAAALLRLVQNAYGIMFTRGYTKLWVEQADKALSLPNPGADLLAERDRLRGLMHDFIRYWESPTGYYQNAGDWVAQVKEALKEKP